MDNIKGFNKKDKWVEVPKIMFYGFNKKLVLAIVNHRKDFKFYGNASHSSVSKYNFKTKQYYIDYKELIKINPIAENILKDFPDML